MIWMAMSSRWMGWMGVGGGPESTCALLHVIRGAFLVDCEFTERYLHYRGSFSPASWLSICKTRRYASSLGMIIQHSLQYVFRCAAFSRNPAIRMTFEIVIKTKVY